MIAPMLGVMVPGERDDPIAKDVGPRVRRVAHELDLKTQVLREIGSRDDEPKLQLRNDDRRVEYRMLGMNSTRPMGVCVLHDGAHEPRVHTNASMAWQNTGVGHVETVWALEPAVGPTNELFVREGTEANYRRTK